LAIQLPPCARQMPICRARLLPAEHSRGSANGRPPGFEPGCGGSNPSPRTFTQTITAGSSNGRMGRSERLDVGSTPTPAVQAMEVIRPRPTFGRCPGACLENRWRRRAACGFESHGFRSQDVKGSSSNRKTPAPQAGPSLLETRRVRFSVGPLKHNSVPWSNGTTSGSHPDNDGSTPSGTIN
jgi:hypothetical protein